MIAGSAVVFGTGSAVSENCVVRAGAVVKQRSQFDAGTEIDGFPAVAIGRVKGPIPVPAWAFSRSR